MIHILYFSYFAGKSLKGNKNLSRIPIKRRLTHGWKARHCLIRIPCASKLVAALTKQKKKRTAALDKRARMELNSIQSTLAIWKEV